MTLRSLIATTIESISSVQKIDDSTGDESDYDISITEGHSFDLSNRVLNKRMEKYDIKPSQHTYKKQETILERPMVKDEFKEDLTKINEFVDVGKLVKSLNELENLLLQPNVQFDEFKTRYLKSSMELIASINDQKTLNGMQDKMVKSSYVAQQSKTNYVTDNALIGYVMSSLGVIDSSSSAEELTHKELLTRIFLLSLQIFKISVEIITPFVLMALTFWKTLLDNELTTSIFKLIQEIVYILLTMFLGFLKTLQQRQQIRAKR